MSYDELPPRKCTCGHDELKHMIRFVQQDGEFGKCAAKKCKCWRFKASAGAGGVAAHMTEEA